MLIDRFKRLGEERVKFFRQVQTQLQASPISILGTMLAESQKIGYLIDYYEKSDSIDRGKLTSLKLGLDSLHDPIAREHPIREAIHAVHSVYRQMRLEAFERGEIENVPLGGLRSLVADLSQYMKNGGERRVGDLLWKKIQGELGLPPDEHMNWRSDMKAEIYLHLAELRQLGYQCEIPQPFCARPDAGDKIALERWSQANRMLETQV